MIADLLSLVSSFIVNIISTLGYPGITVLMALESTCIPIPSEIIMPFSGYLVFLEKLSFFSVVLWGTIDNLIGSIIAYLAGFYGGRPLIKKYGRYIFISEGELAHAQDWFEKYGSVSVLFSRMLPVVRTFISLPAGIAKMPFWKFATYTFFGSLPWSFFLTYVGVIAGENWQSIDSLVRKFDWAIVIIIISLFSWWLLKKLKNKKS